MVEQLLVIILVPIGSGSKPVITPILITLLMRCGVQVYIFNQALMMQR